MNRIFAIDYGLAKTGIAFYDGNLITPLEVLRTSDLQQLVTKICQFCLSLQVDRMLLGVPESGPLVAQIHQLGSDLKSVSGLPVIYLEETLTTQDANARMRQVGMKRGKKSGREDAYAAAILLEAYLEAHNLR
jgi:putative holliday junction resolvase